MGSLVGIVDRSWGSVAAEFSLPSEVALGDAILDASIRGALGEVRVQSVKAGDVVFLMVGRTLREAQFFVVAAIEQSGRVWLCPLEREYHNDDYHFVVPAGRYAVRSHWVVANKTIVWQTHRDLPSVECLTFLAGEFYSGGGVRDGTPLRLTV